jgi:hypothetical protein
MEPLWILLGLFGWLFNIILWFYLIRSSVKSNDIVKSLQDLNKKQDAQIDLLIQIAHKNKQD